MIYVSALAIAEKLQLDYTLIANLYPLLLASISGPAPGARRLVGYPPPGPKDNHTNGICHDKECKT